MKIFSKKLTRTDVRNRLSMKTMSLDFLPPFEAGQHAQTLMVEDEQGSLWPFRLIIRRRGLYRKPVLSCGWLAFARHNQLQTGYKVKFFMEEDEVTGEVKYKIKLKKPYIVFKAKLGYVSHSVPVN